MGFVLLVFKNLTRNPLRTGLTTVAIGMPLTMLLMTLAIRAELDNAVAASVQQLRIITHHKMSLAEPLPTRVRRGIEQLDPDRRRIAAICGMTWFGGQVENAPPFEFGSLALDADGFTRVFSEYKITPEAERAWLADRRAAAVGHATVKHFGWKLGEEFELQGGVPPYLRLRFRLVQILYGPDPRILFFRQDYYDEELRRAGSPTDQVSLYWIKCHRAEDLLPLCREIDALFADTSHPTVTEDESTFISNFLRATGDIPGKLQWIGVAVVLAMAMVTANTMSLCFRERTREMAVFRALGFSRGWLIRLMMAESLTLAALGGLLGTLPLYALLEAVVIDDVGAGPMNRLRIPPLAITQAFLVALAVGSVSGLVPAYQASRLRVVEALRRVE